MSLEPRPRQPLHLVPRAGAPQAPDRANGSTPGLAILGLAGCHAPPPCDEPPPVSAWRWALLVASVLGLAALATTAIVIGVAVDLARATVRRVTGWIR